MIVSHHFHRLLSLAAPILKVEKRHVKNRAEGHRINTVPAGWIRYNRCEINSIKQPAFCGRPIPEEEENHDGQPYRRACAGRYPFE